MTEINVFDMFSQEQLDLLNKLEILNTAHFEYLVIGREFSLLLAEGKKYGEAMEILSNKVYSCFGKNRCFGENSIKNMYIWYKRICRKM